MNDKHHLLIIGFVWPEPQSSAAGSRMMQLISLFQDQGWRVTFASSAAESEYSTDLEGLGIECKSIEINSSSFDDFVKNLDPSIVLFDRFLTEEQFGWRVAEQCPEAMRVLDTEDLHCLRRARKKASRNGQAFSQNDLLADKDAKREIASIYRCDLTLMISEAEMDLLEEFFQVDTQLLHYLPFLLDSIESTKEEWADFADRNHFVTIGNFQHPPNMDAVAYLKEEIWPRISEQLPQAELHIYGSYLTQQAEQLDNPNEKFFIKGRAEDSKEVVGLAKVLLAPLRFGAGLKGKLLEAMQCGTPSVTTNIGAEGINGGLPWSGKIANKPDEMASAAVELYTDETGWKKAQQNGIRIINTRFKRKEYEGVFVDRINDVFQDLQTHRLQNFTGQMLMHHTMASSKYMSRWIEAKNR